jgi:hypothetical protein
LTTIFRLARQIDRINAEMRLKLVDILQPHG